MSAQQFVCMFGLFNLMLAGIAVFCVTQAEDHPEHFALVYVTISIFIFYMGTIIIIIILQIIETYQERQQRNQTTIQVQIPGLKTEGASQSNANMDACLTIPMKPNKVRLLRSQTLPLSLSLYNLHRTSSSTLDDVKNTPSGTITTSTSPVLLHTSGIIHKNYQSFAFVTNDYPHP